MRSSFCNKDDLVVFAVQISGQPVLLGTALLLLVVLDKLPDLSLEVHEKTLGTTGALELFAQLLGYNARCGGLVGYSLGGSFLSVHGSLSVILLAPETGIPQGSNVVGYVLDAMGWVDLPVAWRRWLGVRVVQETIYSHTSIYHPLNIYDRDGRTNAQ
jgi:hypothetical protein